MNHDLVDQLERLAAVTDPGHDPVTPDELGQRRRPVRRSTSGRLAVLAAAVVVVLGLGAAAIALVDGSTTDAPDAPAVADGRGGARLPDQAPPTSTTEPSSTTIAGDDEYGTWGPGTEVLSEADPIVQAVLALLPAGAQLDEARDVREERTNGANYAAVVATVGNVGYEVSIYRAFAEEELSTPDLVPGGKAWQGVTSSGVHYLYYLSDTDVGLYLSMSGASEGDVAAELMDLAESIVADPTLSVVKDDI